MVFNKNAYSKICYLLPLSLLLSISISFSACDDADKSDSDGYGSYTVGRTVLHLTDSDRIETYGEGAGSPRELMVYVWYPAQGDTSAKKGSWLEKLAIDFFINAFDGDKDALNSLDTKSYPDAPILEQSEKFHVILMSHGDGMFPSGNYTAAEYLASYGYVVAGVSHTYNASLTFFPDGKVVEADPKASVSYSDTEITEDTPYTYELWQKELAQRLKINGEFADDLQFTLDELERLSDSEFSGMLNTSEAGVFGHSLGGSGAIETLLRDSRVCAAADLDGSISIADPSAGTDKPVLLMLNSLHAESMHADNAEFEQELTALGWNSEQMKSIFDQNYAAALLSRSGEKVHVFSIKNTGHFNFTDMVAIDKVLPEALQDPELDKGSIDPDLSTEIIREYLLNFYNIYLLGREDELFDSSKYSDVVKETF